MMTEKMVVADDVVVSLDYSLTLDDGSEIDSSRGQEPLMYLQGHGQLIPGLERELYGMEIGAAKKVSVLPDDGYGNTDPDAVQLLSHEVFPDDLALKPGMRLQMATPEGHPMEAEVKELRDDGVLLDFNHPLAGETLHFDISVVDLRTATSEELAHGHVHGPHGHGH